MPEVPEEGGIHIPTELDIIQAALQGARNIAASRTGTPFTASPVKSAHESAFVPPPGEGYNDEDTAKVIEYGKQLKSWVDMQVDARMDAWLATRIEDENEKYRLLVQPINDGLIQFRSLASYVDKMVELVQPQELARTHAAMAEDIGRLKTAVVSCEDAIKDVSRISKEAFREVSLEGKQVENLELRLQKRIEELYRDERENNILRGSVAELRRETATALRDEADNLSRLDQKVSELSQRIDRRSGDILREPLVSSTRSILGRSVSPLERLTPRDREFLREREFAYTQEPLYMPRWNIVGGRVISDSTRRHTHQDRNEEASKLLY